MKLETSIGPIEAADLVVKTTTQEIPAGNLTTTSYFHDGQLVKQDQHVDISEAALAAAGMADL